MARKTKRALVGTMKQLRQEHPALEERLSAYRKRRTSYELKRMADRSEPVVAGTDPKPARHSARRELRG